MFMNAGLSVMRRAGRRRIRCIGRRGFALRPDAKQKKTDRLKRSVRSGLPDERSGQSVVYGSSAIWRARLIAFVSMR
jgi:hypothetical protein